LKEETAHKIAEFPDYPFTWEFQGIGTSEDWKFVDKEEMTDFYDPIYGDIYLKGKLFAFDRSDRLRMMKLRGPYGAIREVLYSRICEQLGILAQSAEFIRLSDEHAKLAGGKSYQAAIFLLPKSEKMNDNALFMQNIRNLDSYFNDQIANVLFAHDERGEYRVTPQRYVVRIDQDTIFSGGTLQAMRNPEENLEEQIERISREHCSAKCVEEKLRDLVKGNSHLEKALQATCKQVVDWNRSKIDLLTDFPNEFQGVSYKNLYTHLIGTISQPVARHLLQ